MCSLFAQCCLYSNDEGCFTALSPTITRPPHQARRRFDEPLWTIIRQSRFSLCVHRSELCLCVLEESGLSTGVCYSAMQRVVSSLVTDTVRKRSRTWWHGLRIASLCTTETLWFKVCSLMKAFMIICWLVVLMSWCAKSKHYQMVYVVVLVAE